MGAGAEFTPRMQVQIHALRTLLPLSCRRLTGAIGDVWNVSGQIGGGGFYVSPDPRIVIFLDDEPPTTVVRTRETGQERRGLRGFYIPAGVPMWSRLEKAQDFSHLDFHIEINALQRRLRAAGVHADLTQPRLIEVSPGLAAIGRIAAEEIRNPTRGEMMLDGLLMAILGEIFTTVPEAPVPAFGGIAPHQLSAVERHLRDNITRHVGVAELADVAGLSERWFAHCFRQQKGETPQRWQSRLRLEMASEMMADAGVSLADIAHATGFADQAHLSRQFRASYGQPPSVWRRHRFPAV